MRDEGVDLRAVTLWSMFGNVDWRFLLTERRGLYDTGAFDVRSGTPRPTVIAKAAAAIGNARELRSPRAGHAGLVAPAAAPLPLEREVQADGR
jgi:dTDP-4-dehydrorhamnose reductase